MPGSGDRHCGRFTGRAASAGACVELRRAVCGTPFGRALAIRFGAIGGDGGFKVAVNVGPTGRAGTLPPPWGARRPPSRTVAALTVQNALYMRRLAASCMGRRPVCRGTCRKYAADKPAGTGQYGEGQARCQICDVWVDAKGARLEDGTIAAAGTVGWHCRCCKHKLQARRRIVRYKSRPGAARRAGAGLKNHGASSVDLSYFNRQRAGLLQGLAAAMPESRDDVVGAGAGYLPAGMIGSLREEFGDVSELLDLAYDIDPPNKISLLIEFEKVKWNLDRVPTRAEFEKASPVGAGAYDDEFDSWENFLDKLGHDPWYRSAGAAAGDAGQAEQPAAQADGQGDVPDSGGGGHDDSSALGEKIRGILESDPDALQIFEMLESDVGDVDPDVLRRLADEVEAD